MSNARNTEQRSRRSKSGIAAEGSWLPVPLAFLKSRACAELSPHASKLLFELLALMGPNATNNGDLSLSPKTMKARGWSSRATLRSAVEELVEAGLIIQTHQGTRTVQTFRGSRLDCSLYAVTLFPLQCDLKKLDISPGTYKRSEYEKSGAAPPTLSNPAVWRRARKSLLLTPPRNKVGKASSTTVQSPNQEAAETATLFRHGTKSPVFEELPVPPRVTYIDKPSVGCELSASADTAVMESGNGKVTVTDDAKVAPRIGDYQRLQHCGDGFQLFSGLGLIDRRLALDIEFGRFIATITGKTTLPPAKSTRTRLTLAKQAQQAAIDRTTKKPKVIEDLVGECIRVRDAESLPVEWEAM